MIDILRKINNDINKSVKYLTDDENYKTPEYWVIAERIGDCEDYALRKLEECIKAGIDAKNCCLATCWVENDGGYHAVLVVKDNEHLYVLDNRFNYVYEMTDDNGYKWDMIQKEGGSKEWVKVLQS
jgi:predicted transglutaminase-like cysteine proteinase